MAQVSFDTTIEEDILIKAIIERVIAENATEVYSQQIDVECIAMDITACHVNGCEIDLQALLESGHNDFYHDVFGIHYHIDRTTGQMTDFFVPRFRKKQR